MICHFDQSILISWQWLVYSDYRFYYLYWSYQLVHSFSYCIFNCFYLLFKRFSLRRTSRVSFFYYSTLIWRQHFFACKMFIFINFVWLYFCCFSVNVILILPLIVPISFYILSKRLFLKFKGYDAIVVSFTKKDGFTIYFL